MSTDDGFKGRVLVLGGRGMLGREVCRASRDCGWQTWGAGPETNIADFNALRGVERSIRPDIVVNCAGIVPQKPHTSAQMVATNALGPWVVREAFPVAKVIHISTDCVFSGHARHSGYSIEDLPDDRSVYGRTKGMGECPSNINVRTSFIGWEHGLLAWLAEQTGEVHGWANATWSGATVIDVAEGLIQFYDNPKKSGIVHLTATTITKYQLLCDLVDIMGWEVRVRPVEFPKVNRAMHHTHAIERRLERLEETRDPSKRVHTSRA